MASKSEYQPAAVSKSESQPAVANKSILRHYFELTRLHVFPRGPELTLWPAAWGILLAAHKYQTDLQTVLLYHFWFAVGSIFVYSGICALNDILDRDLDGRVERTKNRPLVTGKIPVLHAYTFCVALAVTPVYLMSRTNPTAFKWSLLGIFPLHSLYPLMKRVTYWPQAWLGLAVNYGIIVGYLTISNGKWSSSDLILYAGSAAWTIAHDTVYAYQDIEDDVKIGIKSTAVLMGRGNGTKFVSAFSFIFWVCLYLAGLYNGQGLWYFIISVGLGGLHLLWQMVSWEENDSDSCDATFLSNCNLGAIIWLGLFVDYCIRGGAQPGGLISKYLEGL